MGRPSLKDERAEAIMDAYEACVARFGIDGATLERVAEEAGLARPLIRHNVGNRDDLLNALIERFFDLSHERLKMLVESLPDDKPGETMVEMLFSGPARDHTSVLVAEALIAAAATRPELARRMRQWLDDHVQAVADVLQLQYPQASGHDVRAAAAGVTGIYFNVDSMVMLGRMPGFKEDSKRGALLLLTALEA